MHNRAPLFLSAYYLVLSASCFVLSAERPVQAEELRDPFAFGPRAASSEQTSPILAGVLWDPTHPLAIFGDELVEVGQIIAGWRIVEIQQDGVLVQQGERQELILPGTTLPR